MRKGEARKGDSRAIWLLFPEFIRNPHSRLKYYEEMAAIMAGPHVMPPLPPK